MLNKGFLPRAEVSFVCCISPDGGGDGGWGERRGDSRASGDKPGPLVKGLACRPPRPIEITDIGGWQGNALFNSGKKKISRVICADGIWEWRGGGRAGLRTPRRRAYKRPRLIFQQEPFPGRILTGRRLAWSWFPGCHTGSLDAEAGDLRRAGRGRGIEQGRERFLSSAFGSSREPQCG